MQLVRPGKPISIRLAKDLTRNVKRGHAWLFSEAMDMPPSAAGSVGMLFDRQGGKRIASGIYDPAHAIPLRICRTEHPFTIGDEWCSAQLRRSTELRQSFFGPHTTGMRLVAGEGDGLPGLIVDKYDDTAVIKLDGGAPEAFYQPQGIANWLSQHLNIRRVVLRRREKGRGGTPLIGDPPIAATPFLENELRFTADVLRGQKTGFFLDQRDNRALVQGLSKGRTVLNLFSFSGGFSIAAGVGGAAHVTSVDLAPAAVEASQIHWTANGLDERQHTAVVADCFDFLEESVRKKQQWDLVICDPPSFAPSEKVRQRALAAYGRLAQLAARVTAENGLLALASCSSHVTREDFLETNLNALGRARRKATLLAERGLPIDHPTPLAMPELRYLKFFLLGLA